MRPPCVVIFVFILSTSCLRSESESGTEKLVRNTESPVLSLKIGKESSEHPKFNAGFFATTQLQPNSLVEVSLKVPGLINSVPVWVEALDGGAINGSPGSEVKTVDGLIKFNFQAGSATGVYNIVIKTPLREFGVPFWVGVNE